MPKGLVFEEDALVLLDPTGMPTLLQTQAIDRWSDGSIRWVALDWLANSPASSAYRLVLDSTAPSRPESETITVRREKGEEFRVHTGRADFHLRQGTSNWLGVRRPESQPAAKTVYGGFAISDHKSRQYSLVLDDIDVTVKGPVRVSIRCRGRLGNKPGRPLAIVDVLCHFYLNSATVRCELAFTNPEAAGHPGGLWTLGNRGSLLLERATFHLKLPAEDPDATILCSAEMGETPQEQPNSLELYQESSGGENYRSSVHLSRHGQVPHQHRGYVLENLLK